MARKKMVPAPAESAQEVRHLAPLPAELKMAIVYD